MSRKTLTMNDALYEYLLSHSLREPELLTKLRKLTAKLPMREMQISPEQGQFMRFLIELMQAKRTIEVGVFTGYSALCVALALPQDGKIIACDINEEWTNIAKEFWQQAGVAHKIDLYLKPALDTLEALLQTEGEGHYDFAFIDADKGNYSNYYEKCLKLLRQGGLIMIDNVLWGGDVIDSNNTANNTQAIRQLNDKLYQDERITISMLPVGDGITLARKR